MNIEDKPCSQRYGIIKFVLHSVNGAMHNVYIKWCHSINTPELANRCRPKEHDACDILLTKPALIRKK